MFCKNCGEEIGEEAGFCRYCGTATKAAPNNGGQDTRSLTDFQHAIQEQEKQRKLARDVRAANDASIFAEKEYRRLKSSWSACLIGGTVFAVILGCLMFYTSSTFANDKLLAMCATIVGFIAGFPFPFGFSLAKGYCNEHNISSGLFWVVVILLYAIALPALVIVGIPGIFMLRSKVSAAKETASVYKAQADTLASSL